jgi:ATP-binding cassette subfamily B protein
MGVERSLGGMSRTFGLRPRELDPADRVPIERERLRRVVALFRPYRRQWVWIAVCVAVAAGLGVLPPLAVRAILDQAIPRKDVVLLFSCVGGVIGLTVVSGLIGVLQNYLTAIVGEGIVFDLRNRLYRHLQRLSLPFYTQTRAGEIIARVNNDVAAVQGAAASTGVAILNNILTVIATAAALIALDVRMAALALIIVPGLYLPTRLVGRYRRRLAGEAQEAQADLMAFLQEHLTLGGMLLTQGFGQAGADAERFGMLSGRVRTLAIRQGLAGRWLFLCLSVFSVTGPALIYGLGGLQAIRGALSVGTVIAFVAYLTNLYRPLSNLANVYVDIQAALGVFDRIFDFLDREPEVRDAPGARPFTAVRGAIAFERVAFTYSADADGPRALDDLSFTIEPGERVALVGPSGGGKSTVTYLLQRLLDPTSGRILLDGRDLRDGTLESLRAQLGTVTQETFLFHDTVRANLLYARPDATDAELVAAARAANIQERIERLPEGYDTVVGERAFRLSGGERQRLSIARTLLKDPRILILDEATSSLDNESEALIQEALETVLQDRTSVIVAHRLSTIESADRILVLDRGRLVEQGSHARLLANGGLYAALYQRSAKAD